MNKEILKLYNENYNVSPTLPRRFKNPFFIPTENQLLYDLVNRGGLEEKKQMKKYKKKILKIMERTHLLILPLISIKMKFIKE